MNMILKRMFSTSSKLVGQFDGFSYEILGQSKIGVLTLTNPKKRNALSIQLVKDLSSHLQSIAATKYDAPDFTKVLILKSQGSVFSAGHDLKEMKAQQDAGVCSKEMFKKSGDMMTFMQKGMPQITIASVGNFATAAGCQLVCSCDLLVASKQAKFSTPGIKIGLFCSTPGVALARSMANQKKAFELLVTGDPISAQEAYEHGMVSQLVENEADLERETLLLAERIAVHSGETLGLGKAAFYKQKGIENLSDAYDFTSSIMSQNLTQDDCKEGLTSFSEKRHPHFNK